jgi:hypothetical protein
MTVRDLLTELQHLPRDLEVLTFEAGCEDYCEREVDELELQGGRVYLHVGGGEDLGREDEDLVGGDPVGVADAAVEQNDLGQRLASPSCWWAMPDRVSPDWTV